MIMLTPFLQHALRENRLLFGMMHSFNFHPALHIHPARFSDAIPPKVCDTLRNSRRGERRLSAWVRKHWSLPAETFWDFSDPRRRLALLSPDQLGDLVRYCGAATHAHLISRAIDRNTKTQFKDALGEQAYHFAVKRAPLLSRGVEDLVPSNGANQSVEDKLQHVGVYCIAASFADSPTELHRRLQLKVDGDLPSETTSDETARERIWSMLRRILFTEIAPELKPCFN